MTMRMILMKALIEVNLFYLISINLIIDYFKNELNDDKKKSSDKKIDLYKIDREKKTEEDLNNMDDDWEDDNNDFDYNPGFNEDKKEHISDKNIQPIDIRKIGQIGSNLKQKCEIPYLGNGFSDDVKLCDNLICTKCCCKVNMFKNQMWDIDVNYLFFRNNFASPEKLKKKLIESYGTYAYSCQCSWQNISDESVPAIKVSNWVCGGHKI